MRFISRELFIKIISFVILVKKSILSEIYFWTFLKTFGKLSIVWKLENNDHFLECQKIPRFLKLIIEIIWSYTSKDISNNWNPIDLFLVIKYFLQFNIPPEIEKLFYNQILFFIEIAEMFFPLEIKNMCNPSVFIHKCKKPIKQRIRFKLITINACLFSNT